MTVFPVKGIDFLGIRGIAFGVEGVKAESFEYILSCGLDNRHVELEASSSERQGAQIGLVDCCHPWRPDEALLGRCYTLTRRFSAGDS